MTVDQASMGMPVHVGLADRVTRMMTMLVVVIMNMGVLMFQRLVDMVVVVPFHQMQIETNGHQHGRENQRNSQRFAKHGDGQQRANERRHREIGAGPRRPEEPQPQHEEHEADAIAEEADHPCGGR